MNEYSKLCRFYPVQGLPAPILSCIVLVAVLAGCPGPGSLDEHAVDPLAFYVEKKLAPPSDAYPNGLLEAEMNGVLFQVPGDYVGQPLIDESLAIRVSWPKMGPIQSHEEYAGADVRDGVLEMYLYVGLPPVYNKQKYRTRLDRYLSAYHGPHDNERLPGLIEHRYHDIRLYYPADPNLLTPQRERPVFICVYRTDSAVQELGDARAWCDSFVYWPEGLKMHFRFSSVYLKEATEIYKRVVALRDSFVVTTEPAHRAR